MKRLISTIAVLLALGPLSGCGNGDIRERTYAEITCFGFLGKDNDKYECASEGGVKQIDRSKLTSATLHTVTVNRRTGTVAFDGKVVGECRVADFDAWECVERVPTRGGFLGNTDIILYRSGRRDGGYIEDRCNVRPDAPAARTPENCKGNQRYYGVPISGITRLRAFLWDQFCSQPKNFCRWL
jgi:hypothetical protein